MLTEIDRVQIATPDAAEAAAKWKLRVGAEEIGRDKVRTFAAKRITLRAGRLTSNYGSPGELRIAVVDQGIGIDSSEIGYIFDPFYRSPRVQAAQIHGTGLGLPLAKSIAGGQPREGPPAAQIKK